MMQKDKNSITKLIDAIEQKGYVVRKQNPTDRRSNTIVLTDKAHDLKLEAKSVGISLLDKMIDGISEEEIRSFIDIMRKISQNMSIPESKE